jgi:hypothetical protein
MLIEFFCSNVLEYDAAKGRSVACGNRMVVDDNMIGQLVKCEKCQQMVEVPFEIARKPAARDSSNVKKKPAIAATKSTKPVHKGKPSRPKNINELGLADPIDRMPSDVMTFEFEQEKIAAVYDAAEKRCPKCGNLLQDDGKCTRCRYVEPKYESSYLPLDQIQMQLAGFQRWFCAIFNEGVSVRMIAIALHVLLGLLASILLVSAILVGGTGGMIAIILIVLAVAFYVMFIYKGYQLTRNPRARLAWFQRPIWNLILWFARKMNWQGYDHSLKGRPIIDQRNAPIVDEKIPYLDGLNKCHVLDLEGSLITDKALRHFYGLTNLHCLVLRRTKVTHEGVVRLQQANPRLWIWY